MKEQKIVNLKKQDGKYYNYFNTPNAFSGSIHKDLSDGWVIIESCINHTEQSGFLILEREK